MVAWGTSSQDGKLICKFQKKFIKKRKKKRFNTPFEAASFFEQSGCIMRS